MLVRHNPECHPTTAARRSKRPVDGWCRSPQIGCCEDLQTRPNRLQSHRPQSCLVGSHSPRFRGGVDLNAIMSLSLIATVRAAEIAGGIHSLIILLADDQA